jgi:hypothetical protein
MGESSEKERHSPTQYHVGNQTRVLQSLGWQIGMVRSHEATPTGENQRKPSIIPIQHYSTIVSGTQYLSHSLSLSLSKFLAWFLKEL